MVSDDQLVTRLKELLAEVDLQTTTEKMLRGRLEQEFNEDFSDRKLLIREVVTKYLESQEGEGEAEECGSGAEEDEEEDVEDVRPRKSGGGMGSVLSEALQDFLGVESLPRTQVVKKMWEYIKERNLQDPKDKRKILLDDKLKKIFTSPLTMFSMNKQLSKHVMSSGEVAGESSERRPKSNDRPAKKAKTSSGGAKKETGFTKPLKLSAELADLTGTTEMSRPLLMKWIFAYVRENDLSDPSDKRWAICDEKLRAVIGEDRFQPFSFQKYIGAHILKDR